MTNLDIPVPAAIRAVVADGGAGWGSRIVADLQAIELPRARVHATVEELPATPLAVERLTSGRVDYVLFVTDPTTYEPAVVSGALEVMRSDLTTAAVGLSVTSADRGVLELAVSGRLLLVRADALRALEGDDGALVPGPLGDLALCLRLWEAGHRVRSVGGPRAALRDEEAADPARSRLTEILASSLEDDDLRGAAWADADQAAVFRATAGRRRALDSMRRRGGAEILPMLRAWGARWRAAGAPDDLADLLEALTAERARGPRVLVVTTDVLAPAMAGPAIRAVAIARALAREHEVRLVTTLRCELSVPGLEVAHASEAALESAVGWADVIVFQGWVMAGRPWLRDSHKIIVCDTYDPMHLEQLEQGREADGERGRVDAVRGATATLNEQLARADFVLCASAKQRDFWVGALAAMGRVNPVTYDDDPSLRSLIDLAPFGVTDEPFPAGPGAIKGVVPGIAEDDLVVLWGGGVYNWFDPLTLVHAVDRLRARVPRVRLYFLGLKHPNPDVPAMRMATELRRLANDLGLVGTHVFFNEGWVPHEERIAYLRDADVGVSTHLDHVETEFSFRTRILDYLWAGMPIVATAGDSLAALIEDAGAGRTVAPGDVTELESALEELLTDPEAREAARRGSADLGAQLTWSTNLLPLIEFCRAPRRAPDIACPTLRASPEGAELRRGLRRDLSVGLAYLRAGGIRALASRIAGRLRRTWERRSLS